VKTHKYVVVGLATLVVALCGQMRAFGLDSLYDTSSTTTLKIDKETFDASNNPAPGTCSFTITSTNKTTTAGTFSLQVAGSDFTGTFKVTSKGKVISNAMDDNGIAVVDNAITDWISTIAEEEGVTITKISEGKPKITVTASGGNPVSSTITVTGSVRGTERDSKGKLKHASASFTYKSVTLYTVPES
jgi:hypothetical protein